MYPKNWVQIADFWDHRNSKPKIMKNNIYFVDAGISGISILIKFYFWDIEFKAISFLSLNPAIQYHNTSSDTFFQLLS